MRAGNVPVGTKFHVSHLLEQQRSAGIQRLSHHDSHGYRRRPRAPCRVEGEELEGGDVHYHESLPPPERRQPAQTLQRELDLPHSASGRRVQCRQRLRSEDPVRAQSVPPLKASEGLDVRRAEDHRCVRRSLGRQVPGGGQQAPQIRDRLEGVAQPDGLPWLEPPQGRISGKTVIACQQPLQVAILGELGSRGSDQAGDGISLECLAQRGGELGALGPAHALEGRVSQASGAERVEVSEHRHGEQQVEAYIVARPERGQCQPAREAVQGCRIVIARIEPVGSRNPQLADCLAGGARGPAAVEPERSTGAGRIQPGNLVDIPRKVRPPRQGSAAPRDELAERGRCAILRPDRRSA